MEERFLKLISALKDNNFDVQFIENKKYVCTEILKRIPEGSLVGIGGSTTLAQLGIPDALNEKGYTVFNHATAKNKEESNQLRRKANNCSFYLTGINAITEDGMLINMDGAGNRVSALSYGPTEIMAVCGTNKIVKNYTEGIQRIKNIAGPANAKRLGVNTPCVKSGKCEDCNSPQRICNIVSIIQKKPGNKNITVFIVNSELGF